MTRAFFITGGTGLIGRALVRTLLRQRNALGIDSLTLLTRNPQAFAANAADIANAPGVSLHQGDMSTLTPLPAEHYTDFIHGATDVNDLGIRDRLAYASQIVEGTRRSLQFAEHAGCSRFLYLSSGAVYGPGPYPDSGIPENWQGAPALDAPVTAYGQAKRFSEHLCALAAEGSRMAVRIARIFSVIGPESPVDNQYALGNFVRDALDESVDRIRIKGDGRATRSYLHVDDVAVWLIAMNERARHRATFNVGSGREVSIVELANLISLASGSKKEVIVEGTITDYAGRSRYFPDSSALQRELAVREMIKLEQSIRELLDRVKSKVLESGSITGRTIAF